MKLVTFERDWADEFSPFGFAVMSEGDLEKFREYYSKPQDWYFGTNEGFDAEVLMDAIKVTDITQEEADTLTRLFGLQGNTWSYADKGNFPSPPETDD